MAAIPFHVLSLNVFTPVAPPIRHYGQFERAARVKEAILKIQDTETLDAIIVCELIIPACQARITQDLADLGFRYHTTNLYAPFTVAGGIMIFSRHEMVMEDYTLFGDKCTASDCMAAKGVKFARVVKEGQYFNVFAVHMQAWLSVSAQVIREAQIQQITAFIHSLQIPADEAVIFGGDLNIDLYVDKNHIKHMMFTLGMALPPVADQSPPFTVDPLHNQLVGADDPTLYTNEYYPHGCSTEYFDTLVCPCCPSQWIDYTLYSTRHLPPLSASMQALDLRLTPFRIQLGPRANVEIDRVSDHLPVLGKFSFPRDTRSHAQALAKTAGPSSSHTTHLTMAIAIVVLVVILFLAGSGWALKYLIEKQHTRLRLQNLVGYRSFQ